MKLALNAYFHNVDAHTLNLRMAVVDERLTPEEIYKQLEMDAEENGPFQLVVYDTFQAGFTGSEFNSNAEVLAFTRRLRIFSTLPGGPSVLVAMHPTKTATEGENVPYGGGAIMNELDGNLTLWPENGQIKLGWNKVRGPEFEPRYFRIEKLSSPDILDNKGRQILLPVFRPVSTEAAEDHKKAEVDTNLALLRAMLANPEGTQAEWANAIGRAKGRVNAKLQRLKQLKLVEEGLGKWRVTPKGMRDAESSSGLRSIGPIRRQLS